MNQTTEKLMQIKALISSIILENNNSESLDATGEILSDNFQEILNITEQSIGMMALMQGSRNDRLSENMGNVQTQPTERHM